MDDFNIISDNIPVKIDLALVGYGVASERKFDYWHEHKYWQAEFPMSGQAHMKFYEHTDIIAAGDILIVPPRIRHSFEYCNERFTTWSLKFNVYNFALETTPKLLKADAITRNITSLLDATIRQHLPEKSPNSIIEPMHPKYFSRIAIIEYLLAGIISSAFDNTMTSDSFVYGGRIRKMIAARHGANVTVGEAAQKLGYTRGHLSWMFKKYYGISLKCFIDQERAEIARRLLEYSDLNIGGIADIMGFPDIFSFSSFFKRLNGEAPSSYLKNRATMSDKSILVK